MGLSTAGDDDGVGPIGFSTAGNDGELGPVGLSTMPVGLSTVPVADIGGKHKVNKHKSTNGTIDFLAFMIFLRFA